MKAIPPGRFKVGDWLVDPQLDELSRGGEVQKLEPRMIRLLAKLAEAPGQVVSTQQLLDGVWSGVVVGPASVYQAVSQLRKLLGDTDPTPTYIATVPRKGYRLVAPVDFTQPVGVAPLPATARRGRWPWVLGAAALLAAVIAALLFTLPRSEEPKAREPASAAMARERPSLAIAPFTASGTDDDSRLLASAVRELLHTRLITQDELVLLSTSSTAVLNKANADLAEMCRRMNTRFLLQGRAVRAGKLLRVELTLLEPAAGRIVWNQIFQRDPAAITALREEIVARLAGQLRIQIGPKGNVPIDLDAYQLLMRGIEQMLPKTEEAYRTAHTTYFRATVLHPHFARAYLFVGHALMLQRLPADQSRLQIENARKAYERATELDPSLGEAWIGRAELTEDSAEAEKLFKKGIALSPNYDLGYFKYGAFLGYAGRIGEAISQIEKARRLDPLSIMPTHSQAQIQGLARGNVAEHDRLMLELIELHPQFPLAYTGLAFSKYVWGGAPAESAQYAEKRLALDRAAADIASIGTAAYLDMADPAAATSIAADDPVALAQLAQYRRQPFSLDRFTAEQIERGRYDALGDILAETLRDQAIATRKFVPALDRLQALYAQIGGPRVRARRMILIHAHTLVASGAQEEGRELAASTIKLLENESVGRPPHWFSRDLASAYAILGDYDRALSELAESQKRNDFTRWWYTAEHDPLYSPIRKDVRFQALAEAARRHNAQQRALLEEMRRKGEIPRRPS